MEYVQQLLFRLRDEEYARFQAKLTPGIAPEKFIGVRVPEIRKLAKSFLDTPRCAEFLNELPHSYYDENMLHGILLSQMKDFGACAAATDRFLPFVDNWAVCDVMSPKIFAKHKNELMIKIREWASSDRVYTCRFGIEMLMTHFLDGDFCAEYLEIPAAVVSDEYYVNMMLAWFFATALAKQWDAAFAYLRDGRLPVWVHNKTIQKACESFRVTAEQKALLKTMRR